MTNVSRLVKRFRLPALSCVLVTNLLFTAFSFAQSQKPIFPVTPEIGQPASTYSVLADFNGDGKQDVASVQPGALSVALDVAGSSPTTINTPVCTSVGTGPIAVGDVNNDKKPDIVMSCSGYIAVLLGKGDGTFQAPVYYANPGGDLTAPALVDLNGDGYLDVAIFTAVGNTSSLTVYLNGGSAAPGTYGAPKNYSLGSVSGAFYGPLSGDFNGDGKQDLLLLTDTNLIVLYGNGDGTLQAQQTQALPTSTDCPTAVVGDFNHDGATDVAYTEGEPCTLGEQANLQILLGSTNGVFTKGAALPIAPESLWMVSAQLTSDGNLDLIVSGGSTTVFRGDGKGGFTQGASYAAFGLGGVPLVGDLNGDGKLDLLLDNGETPTGARFFFLNGNGDGTFQGVPTVPINTNGNVVYADLNGDGIADAVYQSSPLNNNGDSSIISALGRGDGTFAFLNQSISLMGNARSALVIGDFNGDGKPDLAVATGVDPCPAPSGNNGTLSVFPGNGNGTFGTAISVTGLPSDLGPTPPVVGDFNGDGKLDLIVPYGAYTCTLEYPAPPAGLLFLPGNGDGTFGTPANISTGAYGTNLFVGDLNKDGKLDLLWDGQYPASSTIYLGNGDGTFKQQPLSGPASGGFLVLTDLNGDGIPDLALSGALGTTLVIFAGNGDGSFQTTPFYTVPLPQQTAVEALSVGDVNGDGHPDLVVMYTPLDAYEGAEISVFFGDGKGDFTPDANTYFAGYSPDTMVLARLNNQAPALANDSALDILANTSLGLTSLLNQNNPAPNPPAGFASATTLQASATSGNVNGQITLTATVSGVNPTGSVSFAAGSTALGTSSLSNGTATLQTSFASAGSYSVTAIYEGDSNNTASTSNAVSVVVVAPDFTVTAKPTSATIAAGQSATFTFTVTPVGGYSGTVKFSCGTLPSEATCSFSPATVTPSGSAVTSTLTITTTAAMSKLVNDNGHPNAPWIPEGTLALVGALGIALAPQKARRWRDWLRAISLVLLLAAGWSTLQGCGGGSSTPKNPGTPQGSDTITVTAADSGNGPQHSLTLNLSVQ